ncbi:MAG: NAD(+)/NADH kinase [Actinomycetota bacterium]
MTERLGLVMHHYRPEVRDLANRAIQWCGETVRPVLPTEDAALIDRPDLAVDADAFGQDLDVCLSLGGDGTMLRTCQLVSSHDVPIIGINGGTLGYLTEFDPVELVDALDRWRADRLIVEQRMMISVSSATALVDNPGDVDAASLELADHGEETFLGYALNEAVVSRAESGRSVEVLAAIGGRPFADYLADGLIVATPTGSTAYSLSAGGPIVEPDFQALLLTPVAAHKVFNRSMVLAPTTEIRLTVLGYRPGVVSLDGRNVVELEPGQSVICRAADRTVRFLVKGDRDFHTVLKEKFRLVDE